jgi:thiamine-phosphate pyrophosphorylase
MRKLDRSTRLAWRDTRRDVGTAVTTRGEMSRGSAEDVAAAATGRLTEALRVLEEYGKTIDVQFATAIETLRYATYTLEKELRRYVDVRDLWGRVRLYVLVTESLCNGPWLEIAEAALRGGADALQLREKHLSDAELLTRARKLVALCGSYDAICVINDRPDVARLAGAHGVHVGQDDLDVASVRRMVGGGMLVGKSTHTIEQARAATAEGPDYLAVGPMYASDTKPQNHIAGPETLRAVADACDVPLVAIGGVTESTLLDVLDAGAGCVCVCRAVIAADDPRGAAERLKRLLS